MGYEPFTSPGMILQVRNQYKTVAVQYPEAPEDVEFEDSPPASPQDCTTPVGCFTQWAYTTSVYIRIIMSIDRIG